MFAAKRILYITASKVDVYWLEDNNLNGPLELHLGLVGLDELGKHLRDMPEMLTYLIVDVVEEEFRNESIPHLFGKDKKEYIHRRLNQYYRTSTYRGSLSLGREKTGRRDDKVLFTALTNPDVFTPWIDFLLEHKVPIVGVYTPSALGGKILQQLEVSHENVLLITHQKNSGIRQSFFNNKQLKLSRLVPVAELNDQQYVDYIFSEIEKTRRYLIRLQLLNFNLTLDVCLVSDKSIISEISKNNKDTDLTRLHVYSVEDLQSEFGSDDVGVADPRNGGSYRIGGSNSVAGSRFCDQLYLRILSLKQPALHYTELTNKKYKTFRELRLGMYAASALSLLVAFIWSSLNVIEGSLLEAYSGEALTSSEFIQQEYQKVIADTPHTLIKPAGLKESVDIAKSLIDHKAMPEKLMQAISAGLNTDTALKIEKIQWIVSSDPYEPVDQKNQSKLAKLAAATAELVSGTDAGKLYQIALISGRLNEFSGEYRKAFDAVNKLASALKQQADIVDVQTIKLPLDVNSESNLSGQTGINARVDKASFILRAVLKVNKG